MNFPTATPHSDDRFSKPNDRIATQGGRHADDGGGGPEHDMIDDVSFQPHSRQINL